VVSMKTGVTSSDSGSPVPDIEALPGVAARG
jgi:hypothetical protein